MKEIHFQIDVPITASWKSVELLRASVLNCLAAIFQENEDYCHAVGMIAGELLENAIKYGDWSRADSSSFKLRVHGTEKSVQVEVSNPVPPSSADVEALLLTLSRLRSFTSAKQAYLGRLQEVAERGGQTSQLGLLRIAYEGRCEIQARVDEASVLHVIATASP